MTLLVNKIKEICFSQDTKEQDVLIFEKELFE